MYKTNAYAARAARSPLAPFSFERRDPTPDDVQIEILFCGVCHSDLHTARDEWGGTTFPCVPGHEIVGRVVKVGKNVEKFREGDLAAVGCLVDSCRKCGNCHDGFEQFCDNGAVFTYNGKDKHTGATTYGGYAKNIVVAHHFVLRISDKLDLAATAPLLCAGITTYSPLRRWNVTVGQKVGVVGLGGLGHMAVNSRMRSGRMSSSSRRRPGKSRTPSAWARRKLSSPKIKPRCRSTATASISSSIPYLRNTI